LEAHGQKRLRSLDISISLRLKETEEQTCAIKPNVPAKNIMTIPNMFAGITGGTLNIIMLGWLIRGSPGKETGGDVEHTSLSRSTRIAKRNMC
jgi:hypothetical protein